MWNWKNAIGKPERISDWIEFFNKEIKVWGWKKVINEWADSLAPGLAGAATHGVIRTGHAVRSLEKIGNLIRTNELANGLAYWAGTFQVLPITEDPETQNLELSAALKKIPILPKDNYKRSRSIMRDLENLERFDDFKVVANLIEFKGREEQFLTKMVSAFAEAYITKVNSQNLIRLIHIITSLSSFRSIYPYVRKKTRKKLLNYGWLSSAGLYSISGENPNSTFSFEKEINIENLINKAALSHEVHAIKFTEACLREYQFHKNPLFIQIANDAVKRLV